MTHYEAAIYTARRLEMCEIVEQTLFYFLDRPMVHSPLSELPFMVSVLIIWCLGARCVELNLDYIFKVFFKWFYVGTAEACYVNS